MLYSYPYGFNGQERDYEVNQAGNVNTAPFWEYDARLGRRWNVDPVTDPNQSGYACFNNNPILFSDLLGNDPMLPGKQTKQTVDIKYNGTSTKKNNDGSTTETTTFTRTVVTSTTEYNYDKATDKITKTETTTSVSQELTMTRTQQANSNTVGDFISTFGKININQAITRTIGNASGRLIENLQLTADYKTYQTDNFLFQGGFSKKSQHLSADQMKYNKNNTDFFAFDKPQLAQVSDEYIKIMSNTNIGSNPYTVRLPIQDNIERVVCFISTANLNPTNPSWPRNPIVAKYTGMFYSTYMLASWLRKNNFFYKGAYSVYHNEECK